MTDHLNDRFELIQTLEILLAVKCYQAEKDAKASGAEHKCICPLPESMSDKEISDLIEKLKSADKELP